MRSLLQRVWDGVMAEFSEIKVNLSLSIGLVGVHEHTEILGDHISEKDWNAMNLFEREEFIENEILNEWANGYIDKSFEVV